MNTRPQTLHDFRKSITSQHGEDGVIEEIFKRLGEENRWCVEFGATGGKSMSNTWNLIRNHGWSGVLIESDPVYAKRLKKNYADLDRAICIETMVSWEGKNTLDAILASTLIPKDFDLLVIDIDGNDYHIWEALKNYRPRLITIEYNRTIPLEIEFTQPRDEAFSWGSSLSALVKLAEKKGYELAYAYEGNAFFILSSLFQKLGINEPREKRAHDKNLKRNFFELEDGAIVLYGDGAERLLIRRRKAPKHPLLVLESGVLSPLIFRRENTLTREIKHRIKNSPLWVWIYPLAKRWYKRKRKITGSKT